VPGPFPTSRFDTLPDYPFPRLAALLSDSAPGGPGAPILMSLGEPQHPQPPFVAEILHAARAGWAKYPPVAGTPAFRRAVADWLCRRYGLGNGAIDPDSQILPVAGTKEALFLVAAALTPETKAGRRPAVLIPNPFYAPYAAAAVAAGAEPVFVDAGPETGFLPDYAGLPADLLARTALAYLCNPANPQGAVADIAYQRRLIECARAHDFFVAADECYGELYDRAAAPGALQAAAALGGGFANVLVFNSLSKRSNLPGLRSGFVAGDTAAIARFRRLRAYGAAVTPLPVLEAATAAWGDEAHVDANRALYRAKFDAAERILAGLPGFYRPAAGFFLWLDVGDGERAALRLWREAGVKVLPGPYLAADRRDAAGAGGDNPGYRYIRVALVADAAACAEGLTRLRTVLASVPAPAG
jgi:N-succinyldiaminopimelate aminotransferase